MDFQHGGKQEEFNMRVDQKENWKWKLNQMV